MSRIKRVQEASNPSECKFCVSLCELRLIKWARMKIGGGELEEEEEGGGGRGRGPSLC